LIVGLFQKPLLFRCPIRFFRRVQRFLEARILRFFFISSQSLLGRIILPKVYPKGVDQVGGQNVPSVRRDDPKEKNAVRAEGLSDEILDHFFVRFLQIFRHAQVSHDEGPLSGSDQVPKPWKEAANCEYCEEHEPPPKEQENLLVEHVDH